MSDKIVYRFTEIAKIMGQIDTVQEQMDDTIKKMHGDVNTALKEFQGQPKQQYDAFVTAFEGEKQRLYKLLDDTQTDSRLHVEKVRKEQHAFGEAFGRTANEVGGP
jgi:uncharacterized protein YukE